MSGIEMEIKKPKKAARKKAAASPIKNRRWFAQEKTGAKGKRFLKQKRQQYNKEEETKK